MREIVISKPSATVDKALHSGLGKVWNIVIITDDSLGMTFQMSKDNIKKYHVKKRLACWAYKNWIRAGIVGKFMAANRKLTERLEKFYLAQSQRLDARTVDESDDE